MAKKTHALIMDDDLNDKVCLCNQPYQKTLLRMTSNDALVTCVKCKTLLKRLDKNKTLLYRG